MGLRSGRSPPARLEGSIGIGLPEKCRTKRAGTTLTESTSRKTTSASTNRGSRGTRGRTRSTYIFRPTPRPRQEKPSSSDMRVSVQKIPSSPRDAKRTEDTSHLRRRANGLLANFFADDPETFSRLLPDFCGVLRSDGDSLAAVFWPVLGGTSRRALSEILPRT